MTLEETLISSGRSHWLDIGCGGNRDSRFTCVDILPESIMTDTDGHYYRYDVMNLTRDQERALGTFDLIRLQHTFEHFDYEDGQRLLRLCARLLNHAGYILVTVPDLRIHIDKYLAKGYDDWRGFKEWAQKRIPADAPPSFYFSVYAHSMRYERHKWCYDADGLIYQLASAGCYTNIREVAIGDELSSRPFTHNRPDEDLCVVAQRAA